MLPGPGEAVEEGGLAAVLLTRQGEGQPLVVGQGLGLVLAPALRRPVQVVVLADAGVGVVVGQVGDVGDIALFARVVAGVPGVGIVPVVSLHHVYHGGIRHAQGQGIAVHLQLHGVSHRGHFHQLDNHAGYHAHVQYMLSVGTGAAHRGHSCRLSNL